MLKIKADSKEVEIALESAPEEIDPPSIEEPGEVEDTAKIDRQEIEAIMEEEGIRWYFEQSKEAHVFVASDSAAAYAPIEGEPALPFRPPASPSSVITLA